MAVTLSAVLIGGVAAAGCALVAYAALHPASGLMLDEPKETRKAVLKRVPIGSTAEAAQTAMTAEGYACRPVTGRSFEIREPDSATAEVHAAADYLWCDSGALGVGFKKRWQVFFVDRGGSVSSVAVSVTMSGPFGRSEPSGPGQSG